MSTVQFYCLFDLWVGSTTLLTTYRPAALQFLQVPDVHFHISRFFLSTPVIDTYVSPNARVDVINVTV